jgi:hypothetical protein
MANEFVGSSLIATWTTSTGTTTVTTDSRNFNFTPTISFVDATAGADAAIQRIQSFKDSTVTLDTLMLDNMASATIVEYAEGKIGTLVWGEAGTAAGKLKTTLPAICQGAARSSPYNDVVTLSIGWLGNGSYTIGTY